MAYTLRLEITLNAPTDEEIAELAEELAGTLGDLVESHRSLVDEWTFDDQTNSIRDRLADEEEELDVSIHNDSPGSYLFVLCTKAAKEWADEHIEGRLWMGTLSFAVFNTELSQNIARGMQEDGLVVK